MLSVTFVIYVTFVIFIIGEKLLAVTFVTFVILSNFSGDSEKKYTKKGAKNGALPG